MKTKNYLITFTFPENTRWLYPEEQVLKALEQFNSIVGVGHTIGPEPAVKAKLLKGGKHDR